MENNYGELKGYYNVMTQNGFIKSKELRTRWGDIWTDKQAEAHKFSSEYKAINYRSPYIENIDHVDWVVSKIVE